MGWAVVTDKKRRITMYDLSRLKADVILFLCTFGAVGLVHFAWTVFCGLTGIDRGY